MYRQIGLENEVIQSKRCSSLAGPAANAVVVGCFGSLPMPVSA